MSRIVGCESSWRPKVVNPKSKDYGLFQINWTHIAKAESMDLDVINDPYDNIDFAFTLYEKDGLRHWNASSKCWKRQ